jgi:hypothetical protein
MSEMVKIQFIGKTCRDKEEPVQKEIFTWFQTNGQKFSVIDQGYIKQAEIGMDGQLTERYRVVPIKATVEQIKSICLISL